MKASIEATEGLFIIRLYGSGGELKDVYVVDEVILRDHAAGEIALHAEMQSSAGYLALSP